MLEGLEALAPVELLKSSFLAYPLANALHIAAVGAVFTSIVLLDLRVLGFMQDLPEAIFVPFFRRLALLAFALAVLTGFGLFSVKASEYAAMPLFLAKIGLIVAAAANLLLFARLERMGGRGSLKRAAAGLSLLLWSGVLVCGRLLGFV